MKIILDTSLLLLLLSAINISNATLVSRLNGQAIYDTDLNITWLANANLASTENFGITSNSTGSNCSLSEMGHLFYNDFNGTTGQHTRDKTVKL